MNEIISIAEHQIGGGIAKSVSARDLHAFLEVGKDFSTWIKDRICQYGFLENQDYITTLFPNFGEKGQGRPSTEYFIGLDMAKELAMVERNEKGKQARLYFIECERRAMGELVTSPTIPKTLPEALRAYADEVEKTDLLKLQVASMAPKVEFYDAVTASEDMLDLNTACKIIGVGRNTMMERLREAKIIDADNLSYQAYLDRGYFAVVESKWKHPKTGDVRIGKSTRVFQKGVEFLRKKAQEFGLLEESSPA